MVYLTVNRFKRNKAAYTNLMEYLYFLINLFEMDTLSKSDYPNVFLISLYPDDTVSKFSHTFLSHVR